MNRNHLLPIKKSVVDPNKGLILRTYYIRPETLKKVIQELKEKAATYVKDKKYNEIYDTIRKTGDISILSNFFQDKEIFRQLTIHYNEVDKINSLEPSNYVNVALNKITSFILTNNETYLNKINSDIKKASYKYELKFNIKEKKIKKPKVNTSKKKPKQSKSEKVKEQTGKEFTESMFQVGDFIEERIPYLDKRYEPKNIANILSKYLNFMNPSELKLMILFKKMLGADFIDNSYVAYNLKLLPHLYYKNEFTENLIRSIISFNYRALTGLTDKDEEYFYVDKKWTSYYYFLLDKEKRKELLTIYPNAIVEHIEEFKDWKDALDKGSKEQRIIKLLTADKLWIQKNLYSILYDTPEIDKLLYLKYLSMRKDIPSNIAMQIYNRVNVKLFSVDRAISNLINHNIFGSPLSYEAIILQIIISNITKEDYIPLFEIDKIKEPLIPYLITKFVRDIKDTETSNVIEYIKKRRLTGNDKVRLYINIPDSKTIHYYQYMLDARIPLRLNPLVVLTDKPYTEYRIELYIPKDKLIQIIEGKYIAHSNDVMNYVKQIIK